MGALFGGECFGSPAAAADVFFSGSAPSLIAGPTTVRAWFENAGGVWLLKRQEVDSSGASLGVSSAAAAVPAFAECDPTESFKDGMAVGWGLAAVLLVAWGMVKIRELLK